MSGSEFIMPDGRTAKAYLEDYYLMLGRIESGTPPTDIELRNAPIVSGWVVDEVDYQSGDTRRHIFGIFAEHPFIRDGAYGRTSPLLQLDRGMRWARCWCRTYRLREPLLKSELIREARSRS